MAQRTYGDPILELARRLDGDPVHTFELASAMTDEEAELRLQELDKTEAAKTAAGIVSRLRQQGHI